MNLPHGVCASFIFFSFIIFLLVTWNLSTRWKKFAYWPWHSFLIHVYDKWKKTYKKSLSYYKIFFLIPLKKNWNKKKTKFSYNSINKQSNSFNKKTFLILKKQDTENLTKKTTGKKIRDCISSSHWKNQQMNKKNLKSDKTLHNLTRTEATTCKKKTESTTKQPHKRTHQKKQFSSIQQNLF